MEAKPKQCATCRYFKRQIEQEWGYVYKYGGECLNDDVFVWGKPVDDGVSYITNGEYNGIFVGEHFGCIHHEKK